MRCRCKARWWLLHQGVRHTGGVQWWESERRERERGRELREASVRLPLLTIMIATVLGPFDPGRITGSCSSREELLHKASPATMKALHDNPITLANLAEVRSSDDRGHLSASNRLFSLDESVQELASLDGGGLVMECSAVIDGRDPSSLAEISRRSGVTIVMAASVGSACDMEQVCIPLVIQITSTKCSLLGLNF